ncbi:hypothetical protein HDU98_002251, partial [Podochytrium sp. JEL0797]
HPTRERKYDHIKDVTFETYRGFIEDPMDAQYVVEGVILNRFVAFEGDSEEMNRIRVRSGTVIIETTDPNEPNPDLDENPDELSSSLASHFGSLTGLFPTFSPRTLKPNTRVIKNGITKRSITVKGSDGIKYRVVSYYLAADVLAMQIKSRDFNGAMETRSGADTAGIVDLMRPSKDVGLKDAVACSGVDVVAVYREANPLWKGIRAESVSYNGSNSGIASPAVWNDVGGAQQAGRHPSGSSADFSENSANVPSKSDEFSHLYHCPEYEKYYPYHFEQ